MSFYKVKEINNNITFNQEKIMYQLSKRKKVLFRTIVIAVQSPNYPLIAQYEKQIEESRTTNIFCEVGISENG